MGLVLSKLVVFLLLCSTVALGNNGHNNDPKANAKSVAAKRLEAPIKLDGIVTPEEWGAAVVLDNFTEFRPNPGRAEPEGQRTVAYLVYDDEGIYFGGVCYEASKNDISTELAGRDGFGNNDFVGLVLDTYKDNQNGFEYFVTPLNEQMDAKASSDNEDFSWDAVWESATSIREDGWSFEVFIPFSAIRFSKKEVQDWGLNITRRRQKTGEQFFWSPIDPKINGIFPQEGYWVGLEGIKPPLRLQLSPYVSFYADHYPADVEGVSNYNTQFNGGIDLKLGLSQAFTLDATLIPDFGQVQSDNRVLNLTPFEVRFNENRAFFTEGAELFNKGGLFYSRRIGGQPFYYWDVHGQLAPGEALLANPSEASLVNASKISGRTEKGLGVGVLNAITRPTYAIAEHEETKERRQILSDPLTNYNVLVLDQTLKHNSSVSFVNTSVVRGGTAYDANVSAFLFNLNDKNNMWNLGGQVSSSQLFKASGGNSYGYSHVVFGGKASGRFRFNVWQELTDTKYTSNDLGYFTFNNFINHGTWLNYRWIEPKGWYNNMSINSNSNISHLLSPIGEGNPMYQSARINFNFNAQHKKLHWVGGFGDVTFEQNDFYEPRVVGKYFRRGASSVLGGWFESNNAKPYSYSFEVFVRRFYDFYDATSMDFNVSQSWRVNEKLAVRMGVSFLPRYNNVGFAGFSEGEPVFAQRDVNTVENFVRAKFSFTNRMGLTLVGRHYLSGLKNKTLFSLASDGGLVASETSPEAFDQTTNFFNIDLVYTWQIAQGSFVNIVWKNAIGSFDDSFQPSYFANLRETLQDEQNNNLSVKVIYFLDYNTLKLKRAA